MVEGEEGRAKEHHRLVIWVWLEFGIDVDDEGRADCREQTRLRDIEGMRWLIGGIVNYQSDVEVPVVLFDVVHIVLCRL